jgi:peptide chain release factor 3
VEEAHPGDVIGLNNPAGGLFAIGDALHTGTATLNFEPIPSFSPEVFGFLRPTQVGFSKKSLGKGVTQLLSEGAVQRLKPRGEQDGADPLLAAVGELQFEVVVDRMQGEYGKKKGAGSSYAHLLQKRSGDGDRARWVHDCEVGETVSPGR